MIVFVTAKCIDFGGEGRFYTAKATGVCKKASRSVEDLTDDK